MPTIPFVITITGVGATDIIRPSWRIGINEGGETVHYTASSWAEVDARVTKLLHERGHDEHPRHWAEWVAVEEAK